MLQGVEISCSAEWINYDDTAANWAVLQPQYTAIDVCLYGCRYRVSDCLAVQWHSVSNGCFFVFDLSSFYARYPSPGVDLYYLNSTCVVTGE